MKFDEQVFWDDVFKKAIDAWVADKESRQATMIGTAEATANAALKARRNAAKLFVEE